MRRTSEAVMMALTCSKLTTIALSRPRMEEGYERTGSRTLRSRAGNPVRRIMECFPTSSSRACPVSDTTIQLFTPVVPTPFRLILLTIRTYVQISKYQNLSIHINTIAKKKNKKQKHKRNLFTFRLFLFLFFISFH